MKTRILMPVLLCAVLFAGIILPLTAQGTDDTGVTPSVYIDGRLVDIDPPAKLIESATYVPIAAMCRAMSDVTIAGDSSSVSVTAPNLTITASDGDCYIVANGRYLFAADKCKTFSGKLYVPIRQLAAAFGAKTDWHGGFNIVTITTDSNPIESGDSFYNDNDLLWLSRIISAEARGESMTGKIAVGNVIMNRISSHYFPDSIHGVIFDKRSGIQFTPAYSGAIYCTPSEDCIIAAKLALDGADVIGDSLYFSMKSTKSWASRNRPYIATIGNHNFYA